MTDRAIPLTPPGPLWSQREYVACMEKGIGFTAHSESEPGRKASGYRQWFHYGWPPEVSGCTSVLVDPEGPVKYIDHEFKRDINWIDNCAAAVTKL